MPSSCPHDPFKALREASPALPNAFHGEPILLLLRHRDVRAAAKDWQTFSSDAPFRVPIPSEQNVRSVRQLPIETDPPEHTEYRKLIEPMFRRPLQPEFATKVESLVGGLLEAATAAKSVEIVREFALPLQSRALALLLGVPEEEAEIWIGWGIHVFHDGPDGEVKGSELEKYIHRQFDRAEAEPGDDFFSELTRATFRGRSLTREEMGGFANLVFAGGRDTVINTVAYIIAYFAEHPGELASLRENPKWLATAGEEFVRALTPLTKIGRVCPRETQIAGHRVLPGQRVALGWAAANFDPEAFEAPEEIRLDRRPNPHIAYGSGVHTCIGAAHARLIVRTLLRLLCERVEAMNILHATENLEVEPEFTRRVGYASLTVSMTAR
jgi:cytochrome P450